MMTVQEMANACGMEFSTFYFWATYRGQIPRPTVMVGRRAFYDAGDVDSCKRAVERLQANGSLRKGTVKHRKQSA